MAQYPEWFNSRFGNKLWYTGVGAKEILGHTSLNLPRRLKVSELCRVSWVPFSWVSC
jgi:Diacylglycerol kinase accessory domain